MEMEKVLAEIDFSLSLLEPLAFKVKPTNLSFKKRLVLWNLGEIQRRRCICSA